MLDALEAQWLQSPPVHLLLKAFLGYQAPAVRTSAAEQGAAPDDSGPAAWMQHGIGAIPAPQAARDADSPEARLAAFERLFFGEVKDVEQL